MSRKSTTNKRNGLTPEQVHHKEPIAIVGIGCRFPGGVDSPEKFWALLRDGVNAVSEIPSDRIDINTYYDPRPATPGKMMTRWGGFLDDIDRFDASFFGISPREAERLDPQQRLLLEVAWEALEDSGLVPDQLRGSQSGVFVGLWLSDFESRLFADPQLTDFHMTTGSGRYSASGRLSYFLGLQGPSITVDTACSSSLVAINLACQSLWMGESSMALAGGANIILQPHISIAYSQSQMMAPDGLCKFGDTQADGYVRSEGAAIIVLKPLSQAIADKNPIYALIRGGAVNNDGQSSGFLTTPGQQGQEEMLRLAYRNAGIDPKRVQYIEAHGTGTRAGDPVELGALGAIVGVDRPAEDKCLVGSVKTNFGHTEGAAGIAGLIKVALSLRNRLIPPSLNLKSFNPDIPWDQLGLTIPSRLTPWPTSVEAIAGVSAFGIAGTNAHMVLSEWTGPDYEKPEDKLTQDYPLVLSAHSMEALRDLAKSYSKFLLRENAPSLADICYTAGCRRMHQGERLVVIGKSHQELADQLSVYVEQKSLDADKSKIIEQAKVVFVFPGQGSQWLGMGRELLKQNQIFCEVLEQCEQAIRPWADWSLLEQLSLNDESPAYRLNEISVIQPTLFAIEVALAAVWRSWGIEPAAVVGHSMGEVAAAYVAGALSLDEAARVICKRSQLMQRTSGQGAMAVVGLSYAAAEEVLRGHEDKLSIAVQNSPRSVVLSGDPKDLESVLDQLRKKDVFCRPVKVDVASHSPQMDPLRPELVASLEGIKPQTASIPYYSTVTQEISDGTTLDPEYWGKNLRKPVQFGNMIQRLMEADHSVFIEMSPHPILLASIQEVSAELNQPTYGFASLRRDQAEMSTMLGELGSLYSLGYNVDWNRFFPAGGRMVSLPNYPWQRERYWFETSPASPKQSRPGGHPLLGSYIQTATGLHIWETAISTALIPYLNDHQVRGSAVFPAAGYMEMALAAISEIYGSRPSIIKNVSFQEALFLSGVGHQVLQLVLTINSPNAAEFRFYSRYTQEDSPKDWTLHTSGIIEIDNETSAHTDLSLKDLVEKEHTEISAEDFYRVSFTRRLEYGLNFQPIVNLSRLENGVLAKLKLSDEVELRTTKYHLHPIIIDGCFQTLLANLPGSDQATYLPTFVEKFQVHAAPNLNGELWCYATQKHHEAVLTGDIYLFNEDGQVVMSANDLEMQRPAAEQEDIHDLLYEIKWQESPIIYQDQTKSNHWLIFADSQGLGISLAQNLRNDSQTCTIVSVGDTYESRNPNQYELDPLQPEHFKQLLRDIPQPIDGIIHLRSLDSEPVPSSTDANLLGLLHLIQAVAQSGKAEAAHLWLITRGTQSVNGQSGSASITQAPIWGMGAVIANEFPNLHCKLVDLSLIVIDGEVEYLARILQSDDEEDRMALRNRQRYVARLKRYQPPSDRESDSGQVIQQKIEQDQPFQVQVTTPGVLDHLFLKPALRRSPRPGEVEIAVKATGLNFMNVMGAMGIYPGYPNGVGPLGIECAGVILSVGSDVTGFRVGDEVAGVAFDCLGSHAITEARLIVKKPQFMSFETAASIPIAYITAYYALHSLGGLQMGERVLIHSATGGVGLAAVQLAKRVGAEIFATAGKVEKREYLQAMGIQHVMDSRSLAFAEEVMKESEGEGVDLVLNSLAGSAISKGLEILKPYGRFLEIGKKDIYQNSKVGLLPFQKNLSYFAIDLDKLSRERPAVVGGILQEVFNLMEKGELAPLPVQTIPVSQVSEAFRLMAQAKHIGKIVISMEDPQASFQRPVGSTPVRAHGTYLISGGFGDLGLIFAQWLAKQGARHLVLLGRGRPSDKAQKVIEELQNGGVNIHSYQADVTDKSQMTAVFAEIKQALPPLRGVIHAAGLLADSTILQIDRERMTLALAPKILGAWNLHTLTIDQPLDFFILFSSVASLLGTLGQINYAAGNAFLDALASFRRAQHLPAMSINWGPWSEVGLAAAEKNRGERLTLEGLMSIAPNRGLEVMDYVMAEEKTQIAAISLNAEKWCATHPSAARSSFLADLRNPIVEKTTESKSRNNVREILRNTEPGRPRRVLFESYVLEQVAQVLRILPARLPLDKPLRTLGLDSLMSLELRNRLEDALRISLPVSVIWNYPTVMTLTAFLASKMDIPLEPADPASELMAKESSVTSDIDNLSKAELDALLMEELSTMKDLLRGSEDEQRSW